MSSAGNKKLIKKYKQKIEHKLPEVLQEAENVKRHLDEKILKIQELVKALQHCTSSKEFFDSYKETNAALEKCSENLIGIDCTIDNLFGSEHESSEDDGNDVDAKDISGGYEVTVESNNVCGDRVQDILPSSSRTFNVSNLSPSLALSRASSDIILHSDKQLSNEKFSCSNSSVSRLSTDNDNYKKSISVNDSKTTQQTSHVNKNISSSKDTGDSEVQAIYTTVSTVNQQIHSVDSENNFSNRSATPAKNLFQPTQSYECDNLHDKNNFIKPVTEIPQIELKNKAKIYGKLHKCDNLSNLWLEVWTEETEFIDIEVMNRAHYQMLEESEIFINNYCLAPIEIFTNKLKQCKFERAQIEDIHVGEHCVSVFFIDYGLGGIKVKLSYLRKMPSELYAHPARAIHCYLSEVLPVREKSEEAIKFVRGVCKKNRDCEIVIHNFSEAENKYGVDIRFSFPLDGVIEHYLLSEALCLRELAKYSQLKDQSESTLIKTKLNSDLPVHQAVNKPLNIANEPYGMNGQLPLLHNLRSFSNSLVINYATNSNESSKKEPQLNISDQKLLFNNVSDVGKYTNLNKDVMDYDRKSESATAKHEENLQERHMKIKKEKSKNNYNPFKNLPSDNIPVTELKLNRESCSPESSQLKSSSSCSTATGSISSRSKSLKSSQSKNYSGVISNSDSCVENVSPKSSECQNRSMSSVSNVDSNDVNNEYNESVKSKNQSVSSSSKENAEATLCKSQSNSSALSDENVNEKTFHQVNESSDNTVVNISGLNNRNLSMQSLKSSISDDEFDWSARILPAEPKYFENDLMIVIVSAIYSPDEFYVNPASDDSMTLDNIRENMTIFYKKMEKWRNFQMDIKDLKIGTFCSFENNEDYWYRGQVLEIYNIDLGDEPTVLVQYVDYGDTCTVPISSLRPLTKTFAQYQAFALPCTLFGIKPKSLNHSKCTEWSSEATDRFKQLVGYEKHYTAQVLGQRELFGKRTAFDVILWDSSESNDKDICINFLLSEEGLADAIEKENGESVSEINAILSKWDPMTEDHSNLRNSYKHKDDDISLAVEGHKMNDDKFICKFFRDTGRCPNKNCEYEHVRIGDDGVTREKRYVLSAVDNTVALPKPSTTTIGQVTYMLNPSHFYVTFPYGTPTVDHLSYSNFLETHTTSEFEKLCSSMNKFYANSPFAEDISLALSYGSIVAAKCKQNGLWLRAKVIDVLNVEGSVQVFFIDVGFTEWVERRWIRKLENGFMYAPHQAVECFQELEPFDNDQTNEWSDNAMDVFCDVSAGRMVLVHVEKKVGTTLTVKLEIVDGKGSIYVNDLLVHSNLAKTVLKREYNHQPNKFSYIRSNCEPG